MQPLVRTRVKICCIQNEDEAALAVRYGADAIGLVSTMPSGPGVITDDRIAEIAASVKGEINTFLLTSRSEADAIIAQQLETGVDTIQLCKRLTPETHARLRNALPGVNLVQVVHVNGEASYREAVAISTDVDALLLDTGNPDGDVPVLGGTGRTHDWKISRRIRQDAAVPVYLAGGLSVDNVRAAIHAVNPFGVDICSGVRIEGMLDEEKLAAFCAQAKGEMLVE